jgi:hypothetical protein
MRTIDSSQGEFRSFRAQFKGTCEICQKAFRVGQMIVSYNDPGLDAAVYAHERCWPPDDETEPQQNAWPNVPDALIRRIRELSHYLGSDASEDAETEIVRLWLQHNLRTRWQMIAGSGDACPRCGVQHDDADGIRCELGALAFLVGTPVGHIRFLGDLIAKRGDCPRCNQPLVAGNHGECLARCVIHRVALFRFGRQDDEAEREAREKRGSR